MRTGKTGETFERFVMTDIDQLDSIGAAAYVIEEIGGDPEETFENLQSFKKTS